MVLPSINWKLIGLAKILDSFYLLFLLQCKIALFPIILQNSLCGFNLMPYRNEAYCILYSAVVLLDLPDFPFHPVD